MRTSVRRFFKLTAILLFTYFVYIVGYANASSDTTSTQSISQTGSTPQIITIQDPKLLSVAQTVGATQINDLNLVYTDELSDPDFDGEYIANTLKLRSSLQGNQLNVLFSHEYLHHVWFTKMDEAEKNRVGSDLISMYGNDQFMKERVASYSDKGRLNSSELFSYYCTESSDGYLTQYVLDECNKYINRPVLEFVR